MAEFEDGVVPVCGVSDDKDQTVAVLDVSDCDFKDDNMSADLTTEVVFLWRPGVDVEGVTVQVVKLLVDE